MLAPPSNATNVRIGAAVSHLPCDTWKISRLLPVTPAPNGNGIWRSREENSSFDSPATSKVPVSPPT